MGQPPNAMELAEHATAQPLDVESSYAYCTEVAKSQAKNFYYSFVALPRPKRQAMCAIYAFMRKADDLSDDETKSHAQRRSELRQWVESWHSAEMGGSYDDAIFPALLDTKAQFRIPSDLLDQLVAGTAMDLDGPALRPGQFDTYATFTDLYRYCYLVASVVGLVCIRIFGYTDPAAEKLAEKTGVALQLTNILRDVKEDVERQRIYLPMDQMARYGVAPEEVVALAQGSPMLERHRAMMAETAEQAEQFYQSADQLLKLIDRESRPALWVLVTIYHRLLLKIQGGDYQVFQQRISVPTHEKVAILLQGMIGVLWQRSIGTLRRLFLREPSRG